MADKAVRVLHGGLPPHILTEDRFQQFRKRFRWEDARSHQYADVIEELGIAAACFSRTAGHTPPCRPRGLHNRRHRPRKSWSDPSDPPAGACPPAPCRAFSHFRSLGRHSWRISHIDTKERATLGTYSGPADGISNVFSPSGQGEFSIDGILRLFEASPPPVLFLPEAVLDGRFPERMAWARARGMLVGALLYDLIPVTHSRFCAPDVVARFPEYLEGLAATDAVWAISEESLRQFELYLARAPSSLRAARGSNLVASSIRRAASCDGASRSPICRRTRFTRFVSDRLNLERTIAS